MTKIGISSTESPNDRYKRLMKQSKRKLDKLHDNHTGNKYNAKGQYYGGSFYHSTGERDYAQTLDLRVKAKDIKSWRRQVKIDLSVNGKHITFYYMDFEVTHNDNSIELVEYKGAESMAWRQKYQLLIALKDQLYPEGVTITLVKHKNKYNPFRKSK